MVKLGWVGLIARLSGELRPVYAIAQRGFAGVVPVLRLFRALALSHGQAVRDIGTGRKSRGLGTTARTAGKHSLITQGVALPQPKR